VSAAPPTILIAGAGVVGLSVAALLATGRCADRLRVRVLEARAQPEWRADETDLRVYALSRASQRVLDSVGAWARVAARRACAYRRMHVWEGTDPAAGALEFDSAEIAEPDLGHIVEDSLLRRALAEVLAAAPNAELAHGAGLESVDVDARAARVRLADGRAAQGTLLVAADGGESAIRGMLELPVAARGYGQTGLVTHVATERPHRETAWQRFLPSGPLAFLPLADGRSSVVWSMPSARATELIAAEPDAFVTELQSASAGVLGALGACSQRAGFPLQALHARRYCSARAVLVGDAAHTVHPLAGQGMNLGLADAAALARVVEDALLADEDPGDLKVLRRYERERKGANLEMLVALDALHRVFALPAWAAPLRGAGLRAVDSSSAAKRFFMRRALGLNVGIKNRLRWSDAGGRPSPRH
jgi:2-octaprenylphenol hydroxylase